MERTENDRLGFLWHDRERRESTRGPKRALSTTQVVATAVKIADAEGLDAVSMQRLAKRLGVSPMSLYRYVPGKDELVEAMVDTAAGAPPDLTAMADWRDRVEAWGEALLARYLRHPWMLQAPVGNPIAPNQLSWLESLLHVLADTGLGYEEMISVALFVSGATQGLAKIALDTAVVRTDDLPYDQALGAVIDAERYPTLTALLAAGTFTRPDSPPASPPDSADLVPNLEFGMRQMLAGIEVYVAGRTAGQG